MDANERLSIKSPLNRMNLHMLFFFLSLHANLCRTWPNHLCFSCCLCELMLLCEFGRFLFCFVFKRKAKKCTFEIDVNSLSTPQAKNQALEGTLFFFFSSGRLCDTIEY